MIKDFGDWPSPMLVKELRQGMRSKVLTMALFALQAMLIINAVAAFSIDAVGDTDSEASTAIFWAIVAMPLLLILPGSVMSSIGNEIKLNTLDLVFLTRLTARRIVLGKWISVVAQAALLTTTALPYLALRYYIGGVDIARDLLLLLAMLAGSALLSALSVALSAYSSKVMRVILSISFVFGLQFMSVFAIYLFNAPGVMRGGGGSVEWLVISGGMVLLPLFILLLLEAGAAKIAPAAENHSGPLRLLALLILLVCGTVATQVRSVEWLLIVGQVVVTPICLGALCETTPIVPSLYRAFVRRRFFGKLAARFFTPGWATGFLYTLVALAALGFFWVQVGWIAAPSEIYLAGNRKLLSLLGYSASLLLPLAIISARSQKRLMFYIAFFALSVALQLGLLAISGSSRLDHVFELGLLLPPVAVWAEAFPSNVASLQMLYWVAALCVVPLLVYPFKARAEFKKIAALEKQAALNFSSHAA